MFRTAYAALVLLSAVPAFAGPTNVSASARSYRSEEVATQQAKRRLERKVARMARRAARRGESLTATGNVTVTCQLPVAPWTALILEPEEYLLLSAYDCQATMDAERSTPSPLASR